MIAALKIAVSLLLLVAALYGARWLGARLQLGAEVQRKTVHAALGFYALSFPWIFAAAWEVAALCGLALGLLLAVRLWPGSGGASGGLGAALHGVKRESLGEFYFAFSIALLFYLKQDRDALYVLPLLILTLCDAAAALVGSSYGRRHFPVESGHKSVEGSVVFFITAWLLSMIVLLLLTDVPRAEVIAAAFVLAAFGSLIEAVSWRGLDNLLVPMGMYLLAERLLAYPAADLLVTSAVFLPVLLLAFRLGASDRPQLHALVTMLIASFFIWIVGRWANLFAPFSVFLAYTLLNRRRADPDEALSLVLSIIITALFWYCVSHATGYNTDPVYNLAFGLQLLMVMLRHRPGRTGVFAWSAMGIVLAWIVIHLRYLVLPALPDLTVLVLPAQVALAVLALAAVLIAAFWRHRDDRRWLGQAVLASAGASLIIPLTI